MMRERELLAPAGNFEKLKTALHYGADAVYAGLPGFSLRAQTGDPGPEDLEQWIRYVHEKGRKIYVTVNIYAHNRDLPAVKEHARFLGGVKPDAVIVSDPGVFDIVATEAPGIPIHISTQANVTNLGSARHWERLGASRIVLARELSLEEIREIRESVDMELEAFVHGAVCIAYSGRCYISSFLNNRSGNRGECTNSCRWNYSLMEEKRPGEYFPVFEDERGTHIMSSKDLCMLEHLEALSRAGVGSFKIEGRMKGINYVAGVVKIYREAVDTLLRGESPTGDRIRSWTDELTLFSSRGFTTGMYLGAQPDGDYNHDEAPYIRSDYELAGVVVSNDSGRGRVSLRSTVRPGDTLAFLTPGLEEERYVLAAMEYESGAPADPGRNGEVVLMDLPPVVRPGDLVRRKKTFAVHAP